MSQQPAQPEKKTVGYVALTKGKKALLIKLEGRYYTVDLEKLIRVIVEIDPYAPIKEAGP